MSDALAYLVTFRCYGTWLHGDDRGSMDRDNRTFDTPVLAPSAARREWERAQLVHPPWELDRLQRKLIAEAIAEVCDMRRWGPLAVSARSNHVHAVAAGAAAPEVMLSTFKRWSTRRLRGAGLAGPDARVWSRHGSTRYLWTEDSVARAVDYVLHRQDREPD